MKGRRMAMKDVSTVYDTYLTFQKPVEATGPVQNLDDYEDHTSMYGESRYLRGKNFYAARAANVKTDVEWKIRYRNDIDETMRIKVKKEGTEDEYKYYEIEGILPLDHDKLFLIVKAYEIKYDM